MTTFIKGITLRYDNQLPFLTKLLDTSCVNTPHLKIGSIITNAKGDKFRVLKILYIDLENQDIELVVEDV